QIPCADPAILARARAGDIDAHARLYEIFAPMVYTLARRMLASRAQAEDVLQETFVEVICKIRGCRGDTEFGFWIRRIAVNKCLMHLRSGWVARRVLTEAEEDAAGPQGTHGTEERVSLERALAILGDTARAVVWLHDVEGYTHNEIGRLMGRTASFSKSQLARAHERLRTLLEGERLESAADLCTRILKPC
ncbi:MAG TPA: sigma-70 family RNA polymerase sigma factor, partial [Gammaproteobacteria bacterium]|nr:sigma-70 family RNA polymerase sigma factor [Gammaproteobacteria bacterium]